MSNMTLKQVNKIAHLLYNGHALKYNDRVTTHDAIGSKTGFLILEPIFI